MEEKNLNIVKLFLIKAKESNILELDENEFRENFFNFKNFENYEEYLTNYVIDENNICLKFEKELNDLIVNNQIQRYKNYIYIYNMDTNINIADKDSEIINSMIFDYIKLNMGKQKVKVG